MILLFKFLFTKSWTWNAIKQDEFITIEVLFFPLLNCSLENLCALSSKHSSRTLICLHSLSKHHWSRSQEISERPAGKGNNHGQEIKLLKKWEIDCQRAADGANEERWELGGGAPGSVSETGHLRRPGAQVGPSTEPQVEILCKGELDTLPHPQPVAFPPSS